MKIAICTDPHVVERNHRARKDNFLDTVLGKLDYIAKNSDKVIIAGDLFHINSNSTFLFNKVFTFFNSHRDKFIIIPGNHDLFHNNYASLERTTLGSLYYTGAVDIKTSNFVLGNTEFGVSLCIKNVDSIPIDKENNKILIGHNYYGMDLAPKESLTKEDIAKLNYRIVFLGHDHKPYEEEFVGNSILIRMGSLTRIDTQEYNRDREVCYYEYDTETTYYTRRVIPYKSTDEVYIEGSFKKNKNKSKDYSFIEIADILAKLEKPAEGNISLHKTLVDRLKTPSKKVDYIRDKHRLKNVSYN